MNIQDITLVTAIDQHHIKELTLSYQTWKKYKKEILDIPKLLIYDNDYFFNHLEELDQFKNDFRLIPWSNSFCLTQREKMLSSLVHVVAKEVKTTWYLKMDTDTLAVNNDKWIYDEWFQANENGKTPVIITNPWGYTKPANLLDILDDWGDVQPYFNGFSRLNIPYDKNSNKVISKRIISWLMFGNTNWTKEISSLCKNNTLPVPSQDTFLYYCAARRGEYINKIKMSRFGWNHMGRKFDKLVAKSKELLNV